MKKAIDYATREQVPDPETHLPVNWKDPPGWADDEYLCLNVILKHVSRQCRCRITCETVIGPEKPTIIASLYSNRQDFTFRKRRLDDILRQIREAFGIADSVTPAWWWDYLECGYRYVHQVAPQGICS